MVNARLIVLVPPEVKPRQVVTPSVPDKIPEVKPEPEETVPEVVIREPRLDLDEIRRTREREASETLLKLLAQASFLEALQDEADDLARSDAADDEAIIAQTYRFGIYKLVVANWSRPPSARNNMEAKLLVELLPTGDVVSVTILEPSGNGAFDRSAEAAVRKARRFDVPVESRLFERYFRRFTLLFRPGDLLR